MHQIVQIDGKFLNDFGHREGLIQEIYDLCAFFLSLPDGCGERNIHPIYQALTAFIPLYSVERA
ncbi:hypothetical protein HYR99_23205 [Candidatus Poribacteria bacterium]|nr:hypothetical protein [Candidatus Poribacteria bacterium]